MSGILAGMRITVIILLLVGTACSKKEQKANPPGEALAKATASQKNSKETSPAKSPAESPAKLTTGADKPDPANVEPNDKASTVAGAAAPVAASKATSPAKNPVTITAMVGPEADLKAFCGKSDMCETDPASGGDDDQLPYPVTKASALAAPFEAAHVIAFESPLMGSMCKLTVKVGGQWYAEKGDGWSCWDQQSRYMLNVTVTELAVREFAFGDAPEVILRTTTEETMAGMDGDGASVDTKTETITACGVGKSGKPGCFKLDTSGSWDIEKYDKDAPNADLAKKLKEGNGTWKVAVSWHDGVMHVTGDEPEKGHGWTDRRGRHKGLSWP